jgi:hypothetical protein
MSFIIREGESTEVVSKITDVISKFSLSPEQVLALKQKGNITIREKEISHVVFEPVWNKLERLVSEFRPKQMWFRTRGDNDALTLAYGTFSKVLEVADPEIKASCLPGKWVEVLPFLHDGHFATPKTVVPPVPEESGDKVWQAKFTGVCFGTIYSGIPKSKATQKKNVIANKWTLKERREIWQLYIEMPTLYDCLDASKYSSVIGSDVLDFLLSKVESPVEGGKWYMLPSGNIRDTPT